MHPIKSAAESEAHPSVSASLPSADSSRNFGVYHKGARAYFSRFDGDGNPVWADANDARRMTKLEAEAQAACFIAHQHNVQRKAARL